MNYFKDCQTLDEAKKVYKEQAFKLHPDVGGNKADFQEMLNQFHAFTPAKEKYQGEAENWDSREYAEIIEQLMQIAGINIHICGSWIWLDGDAYPVRNQIKDVDTGGTYKRGFSGKKRQWYFSPVGYKKRSGKVLSFDRIQNLYGNEQVKKEQEFKMAQIA